jgi:hypothetical protein
MMGFRVRTFLMLVIFTIIVFSATLITHPAVSPGSSPRTTIPFCHKMGSEDIGFGKFRQPLDIAIDSYNNLYVTHIQQVGPTRYISLLLTAHISHHGGVLGFGDGHFAGTAGIGTDSSGNSKRYQRI